MRVPRVVELGERAEEAVVVAGAGRPLGTGARQGAGGGVWLQLGRLLGVRREGDEENGEKKKPFKKIIIIKITIGCLDVSEVKAAGGDGNINALN